MDFGRVKNFILGALVFAFLAGGVGVGVYVVKQNQDVRSKASSSAGTASVSLSPTTTDITAGSSVPVTISFNPAGEVISAIAVRLSFTYTGDVSELSANQIVIDSGISSTGEWMCPVRNFTAVEGKANIDIACAYAAITGYTQTGNINLASFNLVASPSASNRTYTITFDPQESIITKKSDSSDVLLTPSAQGTYTITGGSAVTPTPTSTPILTPTPTTSATPMYRCSGAYCVRDDITGTYTTSDCSNSCVAPVTRKYRCSTYSCVQDDVNGTYLTANCDNACVQTTTSSGDRSLPRAGNPLITVGVVLAGLSLAAFAFLLL